jgi:hypothetical protein
VSQSVPRPGGIAASRFWTLNEITSPIVPTGTTRLRLRQAETGTPLVMRLPTLRPVCPNGTRCHRPIYGAGLPPACGRPLRVRAPCRGAWQRSSPKPAKPTIWCYGSAANGLPRTARLSQLVAAPADPTLHIGRTGLVAPGRQAEVCTNVARSAEAIRPIDRCAERKGSEWPDTLHGHQPPARWLDTNLVEHTFGEPVSE